MSAPLVLGIETSCDETGAGLVRGRELLADAVASSVAEHARFGGVVPEVASRAHLEAMVPAVDRALATAGVRLSQVDAIAVTAGPGLAGALLVGVCAAKAYALALGKPLYGVNHLAAHVAVDQLEHGPLVLGIETSCDETGAGIVRGRELLADEVASSMVAPRGTTSRVRSGTSSREEWPPETSSAMAGAGSGPCSSWSTATCAARWLTP